jgi:hypothetical protein
MMDTPKEKIALIITSIAPPNAVMETFAAGARERDVDFIVIGDTKSPADFNLPGCDFHSIARQESSGFRIAGILPKKHYARKNIGYLLARNHDIIIETDDDNFPFDSFWHRRHRRVKAGILNSTGWINVYGYFSSESIWPRGFPLEQLQRELPEPGPDVEVWCPIQQGLADKNPDVDAVYRMTSKLPLDFEPRLPLALGERSWCPFNSQNTTWFKEAFPLLYLPSYCSFRMTDIWRSFVAQRITWTCGWSTLFHSSTVWQDRNEHNLLKDFEDEIPGYLNNSRIAAALEDANLESGESGIGENLMRCYKILIELGVVGENEMYLLECWIEDLANRS